MLPDDDARDVRIGLPHPVHISGPELAAWARAFQDYEILQPFPQLGRPVFRRTPEQAAALALRDLEGTTVPTARLLGLEGRGWKRVDEQSGTAALLVKPMPGGRLQAEMPLDPGIFAVISAFPTQELGPVVVRRRRRLAWVEAPPWPWESSTRSRSVSWRVISPGFANEVHHAHTPFPVPRSSPGTSPRWGKRTKCRNARRVAVRRVGRAACCAGRFSVTKTRTQGVTTG